MEVYSQALYDDFTGFTFNGQHSSQFGLLRVSDGDRYEDNFVPSLSNESTNVPGGFGKYYLGETVEEKKFRLSMAYDNIGERDKRRIKLWLHPDDKLHELIFDEKPYIKYWVKCDQEVVTSELCFFQDGKRVYKGDFKINFTAYMPFGIEISKELTDFKNKANYDEWKNGSGLLKLNKNGLQTNTQNTSLGNSGKCNVYNGGDVETGFTLEFKMRGKSVRLKKISDFPNKSENIYGVTGVVEKELKSSELVGRDKYCIFDDEGTLMFLDKGNLDSVTAHYEIADSKNKKYIQTEGIAGKIVTVTGGYANESDTIKRSKFESFSNGQLYDIYTYGQIEKEDLFYYEVTGVTDKFDKTFWGKLFEVEANDTLYKVFGVRNNGTSAPDEGYLDSYGKKIYTKITIPGYTDAAASEFLTKSITDSRFEVRLVDSNSNLIPNHYFKFYVPGISTTNSKYWSDAQKAIKLGGWFKFDTDRKIISYRQDEESDWVGLTSVLSEGMLFKLPSDLDKYFAFAVEGEIKNLNQLAIIQTNPISIGEMSNFSLSYKYLYI